MARVINYTFVKNQNREDVQLNSKSTEYLRI